MKNNSEQMSFSEWYKENAEKKKINECSWFGIVSGFALFLSGIYQSVCTDGVLSIVFKCIAVGGAVLIICGSLFPDCLKKAVSIVRNTFSFVGDFILKLLLVPVYCVMVIINIFTGKAYRKKFGFFSWSEDTKDEPRFENYRSFVEKKSRYATFDIINGVFSFFLSNRMYVAIPVVVILLILGAIVFFASSNAVFSFVYTLF